MITWAKFLFYGGQWHFQGFTSHEAEVRKFEDFCANETVISVVLALQHPDTRPAMIDDAVLPAWRRVQSVQTTGDRL